METELHQSTDYLKFTKIKGNRNLSREHIKRLCESIKSRNLLHLKPIIVDEEFRVLDGQHRLEAARELQTPIYYIKCNSETYKEIAILNQNQRNWTPMDFVRFYADNYNDINYKQILDFIKEYEIRLDSLFLFMNYNIKKQQIRREFQNGEFIFPSEEKVRESISEWKCMVSFHEEKESDYILFLKTLHFQKAFIELMSSSKVDKKQFWDRIKNNLPMFYVCRNKDEVLDMLLKIYNKQSVYKLKKEELYI